MKTQRLEFIDVIRSVAILMMLEGHFITHTLQESFRTSLSPIYETWKFTRGITAPLFLTTSGLIFTYLLLKNKIQGFYNSRVQKGFSRVALLIATGYLLQFTFYPYFFKETKLFNSLTEIYHVLQCIGTSLLMIILLYLFRHYVLKIPMGIYLTIAGLLIIMVEPTLQSLSFKNVPQVFVNMLITVDRTDIRVSEFPIFPWSGYVLLGGALGSLVYSLKQKAHHVLFPIGLIVSGLLLTLFCYDIMTVIWNNTQFLSLVNFQGAYQLFRLGNVFVFIGIIVSIIKIVNYIKENTSFHLTIKSQNILLITLFAAGCYLFINPSTNNWTLTFTYFAFFFPVVVVVAKLVGWNYDLFIKVGQNTLSIYVLHVIVLYRGLLGIPFDKSVKENLSPFYAIIGAIVFIFAFVVWVKKLPEFEMAKNRLLVRLKYFKRKTVYRLQSN